MVANALLVAVAILIGYLFWLMGELKFLAQYRNVLFHFYGNIILAWFGFLFLNAFAAVYLIERKFFLKDTGRKLSHLDRQVTSGQSSLPSPHYNEDPH